MLKITDEQIEFLKANVKGRTEQELANLINSRFGTDFSSNSIRHYKYKFRLKSDVRYQKGNIPHNHKPIGYEFIDDQGYIRIKIAEPNTWEYKQRYIWKKYFGDIPEGYRITFKDGNKTNMDINNLLLISPSEILRMNDHNLFSKNKELTETGLLLAKLINKIGEVKRSFKIYKGKDI